MIVAHPDDESIFGGATLLQEKGWKVVCLTNGDHPVRSKEFRKAMEYARTDCEMWCYPDQWMGDFNRKKLSKDIGRVLKQDNYEKVVTHGPFGEYGHTQHQALFEIVSRLVSKNLYVFEKTDEIIDLTLLRKKLRLLKFYKSQDIIPYREYVVYEGLRRVK